MEFEEQNEHEEETELPPSYDSLGRPKMPNSVGGTDAPPRKPKYRECLKNHAVGIGAHAVDGCGEFMPVGTDGSQDELKCAACNCHRNFHRKEADAAAVGSDPFNFPPHHHHHHHQHHPFLLPHYPQQQLSPYYRSPSGYLHVAAAHQRPLALPSTSGGGGGSHSREDEEDMSNPTNNSGGGGGSKKRFRTKFSQDQKEKMLELAGKLGWRIQKHDDDVVQQFCNETGVKRHVLKVWMHNNKHTLGKKP